jgi:hypothetical protein
MASTGMTTSSSPLTSPPPDASIGAVLGRNLTPITTTSRHTLCYDAPYIIGMEDPEAALDRYRSELPSDVVPDSEPWRQLDEWRRVGGWFAEGSSCASAEGEGHGIEAGDTLAGCDNKLVGGDTEPQISCHLDVSAVYHLM